MPTTRFLQFLQYKLFLIVFFYIYMNTQPVHRNTIV